MTRHQIGKFLFPLLSSDQRRHRLRIITGTVLAIIVLGGFIVGMFFLMNKPNN